MSKMVILGLNCEHVNPMWRNYMKSLSTVINTQYFGPGYSCEDELKAGLKDLLRRNQDVDAILVTSIFLEHALTSEYGSVYSSFYLRSYWSGRYNVIEALRYCSAIYNDLLKVHHIPIIFMSQNDLDTMPAYKTKAIHQFLRNGWYYIGMGYEFSLKSLTVKHFGSLKINLEHKKLCQTYESQIISLPIQSVTSENFDYTCMQNRKYDWVIAGTIDSNYPQRIRAKNILQDLNVSIWDEAKMTSDVPYRKTFRVRFKEYNYNNTFERLLCTISKQNTQYIKAIIKSDSLIRFRQNYINSLIHSKCAYVGGSGADALANKYMEVPAAGTLMVGAKVTGFECLGFKENEHFLNVSLDDLPKKAKQIKENLSEYQTIVDNARNLVTQKHTSQHRAILFRDTLEVILRGGFAGSFWENGEYYIRQK